MSFPFTARSRPAPTGRRAAAPIAFASALLAATAAADAETLKIGARSFDFVPPAGLCVLDPGRSRSERSARLNLSSADAGVKTAIVFADCRQLADWRGDPTRRITRFGSIAYDGEQLGNPTFADPSGEELSALLNDAAETFRVTAGALPDIYLQGEFPKHASSFVALDHLTGVGLAGTPVVADDMFKSYVAAGVVADEQEVRFGKVNGATIFAGTIVVVGIADRIASDGDLKALDDDMVRVVAALRAAAETSAPAIAEAADDPPAGPDLSGATVRPTVSEIAAAPPAAPAVEAEVPLSGLGLRETLAASAPEVPAEKPETVEKPDVDPAPAIAEVPSDTPADADEKTAGVIVEPTETEVTAAPSPVPAEFEPIATADIGPEPEPADDAFVVVERPDAPDETPAVVPAPQTAALTAPPAQTESPEETAATPLPDPVAAEAAPVTPAAAPQPAASVRRASPAPAVLVAPTKAPGGGLSAPPRAPGLAGPALVSPVTIVGE